MSRVLVIGAGGVASVAVHRMAMQANIFPHITLASRTLEKCTAIAQSVAERTGITIATAQVDAEDKSALIDLIHHCQASHVVHLALPYQDLVIMEACLAAGAHYIDTANYEPRDEARFEYHWQWAYHDKFAQAGLMAVLGCGFDPGVTSVFTAWLRKHHFNRIDSVDILDCNGGDHGQAFATNFNPEINIREVTAPARYWQDKEWHETPALEVKQSFDFDQIGEKTLYLMYHEEIESLKTHFPEINRIRFWMTFSESYIQHLTVLQNVGMTRIDEVDYHGQKIVPLQFLKAVLPEPASLGASTIGKTNIGVIASGIGKDGAPLSLYLYNICDHQAAYRETGNQAVSYTTGVPAMIGTALMIDGTWEGAGVFNIEQLDPDPFMDRLMSQGLPWKLVKRDSPLDF